MTAERKEQSRKYKRAEIGELLAELEVTERRLAAMIENRLGVRPSHPYGYVAYSHEDGHIASGPTPEVALDAAIEAVGGEKK